MEEGTFNYEGLSRMVSEWEQRGFSGILREFVLLCRPISINAQTMIIEHDHALFLNPYWGVELSKWLESSFNKKIQVEVRKISDPKLKTLLDHRKEMMQQNTMTDMKKLLNESFLEPFADHAKVIFETYKKN